MPKKQSDILQDPRIIDIITNNVQSSLFLMDNKARIIWANKKLRKWFGPLKGIIGKPCSYFIENHKKRHCACMRTLKTKKFETGTAHGATQGTENIFFESFSTPIFDRKGRMAYMMGEIKDITHRKKAEDEIKKQKQKAEKYLDLAGSIIVALDSAGRIILLNKKGYEILGYKKGKLIGERWIDTCIPQKNRADVRKIFNKIMQGDLRIVEHFENPVITKQRDRRIISWHNSVLKDDKGDIIGTLSSGDDITDKKKAEEELKANETRFRLLYENAPLGYQSLDKDGRIIELNKTWLEMLGYSKDKVIGKPFSDFITPSYKKGFSAFKKRGWMKNSEYEMIRKDRTRILVSIDGRVAYDEKGQFLRTHCIIHEITKRKEAEAKVKKYAEELEDMVKKRTRELDGTNQKLRERIDDLERFHNIVVGRELKMIELKKEIKRLKSRRK